MNDTRFVIPVHAEHSYDVVIGRGIVESAASMIPGAGRIAVLHAPVMLSVAERIASDLSVRGIEPMLIALPDAEAAKRADVLVECWERLGAAGFTRNDGIISVGGGATTDLAGFVAASWLRGIRVVHVPTTLLGMVDAAVGGKTGINTRAGKNLVGAFHSPVGVVCDVNLLTGLPAADLRAGMAEVVKVGFTRDLSILEDIEADPSSALDVRGALLPDLIRRAVQVKAEVVTDDFRETSATSGERRIGREVLNYGHTFGHAIERSEHYTWRHGDAVAVGMIYVAELAHAAGLLDAEAVATHRSVLTSLGLPTTYESGDWPELRAAMGVDKKSRGSMLRFVVLQGLGDPVVLEGPEDSWLESAYRAVSA